jgi:peptidyl-prolyl cis-trans isomerase SurA
VDFKSVSAQYSERPSVGEIGEEDLRPEIKDKILAVPVGGMTDIIQVSNGFYIFKVEARDVGKNASLKEAKDRIYQKLYEEKFRARFQAWLSDLRKKAYVEIKK